MSVNERGVGSPKDGAEAIEVGTPTRNIGEQRWNVDWEKLFREKFQATPDGRFVERERVKTKKGWNFVELDGIWWNFAESRRLATEGRILKKNAIELKRDESSQSNR